MSNLFAAESSSAEPNGLLKSLDPLERTDEISIDGYGLRAAEVAAVARSTERPRVTLSADSCHRMAQSRRLKDQLTASGIPIYGVTSGFGDSNTRQISDAKAAELQKNLIRFLGSGVGPAAPDEVVRATMLVRANCLARGASGVRPELVRLLIDCLNLDLLPVIPERGSVGASGDLVPLSYLAGLLTGQAQATYQGIRKPADQALVEHGLAPVELVAKEGLALVNGTSFMSGFAVLALRDAAELAFAADLCTALTSQVLRGNPGHFADFLFEHKPHTGVRQSATLVRRLLSGSASFDANVERPAPVAGGADFRELDQPIQDRYSIRCAPHVTGTVRDTLEWAEQWITTEINSANDNPLFDVEAGVVRSGGNFYGGHVGLAMDALKTAVAGLGDLLDRQLELTVDEKFNNGLTPNLIPRVAPDDRRAGLHHGFKGMQITASALAAEALKWTMPASSFSRSTEAHNQDKVSMGTIASRDAYAVGGLVRNIAAIHLMALCQAADLRGPDSLSRPTRIAYELVRKYSPHLDGDRPLDTEIELVSRLIASGELRRAVTAELTD
ncbi:aromatic amino acid ammonia-lyase [Streptomyces sp. S.PNR 29]|uniref:HAL/PAL/TAL family ammonia-lyase n=1 Tax=Streptomyces sp. S.PNR 29 TaxID=2973805 RepID=UPI0025B1BE49|nr:aromatic amino acid ammonia-lyase [Streptomyces sp. S.PNR 29]MDN0200023.1 aromatic amino acid ammonia-lyase [Streptomyces sp. S.PNR 29]